MANQNPIGFTNKTFALTSKVHLDKQILTAVESRGTNEGVNKNVSRESNKC